MKKTVLIFFLIVVGSTHCQIALTDTIQILSWNVFLRPSILKDRQLERVEAITQHLIDKDADILVLQEVFHKKSKKILINTLSKSYPFHTKEGKKSFWGIASGVYIFCKDSILSEKHVDFISSSGTDALAKKGAVKIRIKRKNKEISVVGTHLQAGEGPKKNLIRKKQLEHLAKLNNEDVTLIYAGDFNIRKKSTHFNDLREILDVKNLASNYIETANFNDQELFPVNGKPVWIDFILINQHANAKFLNLNTKRPKSHGKFLSDHSPVYAEIIIN